MNLIYKNNYWNDNSAKQEFIKFLIEIHNLDLSLWDKKDIWDYNYQPFSYFENDRVVSSVCLYSMDMMIKGERKKVAQISGVGTLPEYRRQGLNYKLTQKVFEYANKTHDFYFLFADDDAFPFYKRCGFRTVSEYKIEIKIEGTNSNKPILKLDINNPDHFKQIYDLAKARRPISKELGVFNEKLFMFWCLNFLSDSIYYIKNYDTLVLYARNKNVVTIYDIVSRNVISYSDIYSYLSNESDRKVEFLFMTDQINIDKYQPEKIKINNGAHLLGKFPFENDRFIIPFTAHA